MKTQLADLIKRAAVAVVPQPIVYRLWHLNRRDRPRTTLDNAFAHRVFRPQDGVSLEVYWADVDDLGRGPCASVFVLREEIMRLDCFGGRHGHMHINADQVALVVGWDLTPRFFFPPGSRRDHVERAVFEIATNTVAALQTNHLARVREFAVDRTRLAETASQVRTYMLELLERYEGASDHAEPQMAGR